ncbi:MAG: response regulator transcription factor [Bacteroidetes bacterium]|nr:response regulator transcription factor [Bacteroidota bacterium]
MKLLIADDHILVRKGLRQVLESQADLEIIEAENGEEAIKAIRAERPAVALLDVEMPLMTGFDVARRVQSESLPVALVFLTMFKEETVFNKAMDLGVKGYVLKENTISEVLLCVRSVAAGKYYLSPSISDYLLRRNTRLAAPAADSLGLSRLTPAERNVLKLVAAMKSNQQIADALGISVKTVQNHRNNICDKLDLSGAHALLKFSVEHASMI